jgi:hypothetical protein
MTKSKPWDIPPVRDKGDDKDDTTYTAVGRALTRWEWVEEACGRLFAILVGAPPADLEMAPAVRAYGAIVSFNARSEMLRAAAVVYFLEHPNANLEKRFEDLMSECTGFATRRNEIAHGKVLQVMQEVIDGPDKPAGHYLIPNYYNPRKFPVRRKPTYQYTSREILYFWGQFSILGQNVSQLADDLAKLPPPSLETPAPLATPRTP